MLRRPSMADWEHSRDEVKALARLFSSAPGVGASLFDELLSARERVESILQVVVGDDGVLVQDFSGRIVYANAGAAAILGVDHVERLLRMPLRQLVNHLEIRTEDGEVLGGELPGTAILRGAPASERTLQLRFRQSEPRWVTVRALPMHDHKGAIVASISILRDVTAERRTADFRENLLGIVSHDLKSPLTAIGITASLLARRAVDLDPRTAKMVLQIQSSADRASRLVRDLLDLTQARLGGGIPVEPREVEVVRLVEAAVDEVLAGHPDRTVELRAADAGTARWDPDRLGQVLTNLLSNALAYSAAGTPVRAEVAGSPERVLIKVHNHGTPIPPERQAQLFEPFMRGAASTSFERSVGLGLYIVKEIVGAHGGTVSVRSTSEAGTTFTVDLPRRPVSEGGE
jgi:signal transduction histidine kinase